MEWWQSLLLAIIPAVIAAIIAAVTSIIVSNKQISQAKNEINLKYKSENKLYISKTRYDLEISIYRELSDKFLEMIYKVAILFPRGIYQEDANIEEEMKNRKTNYSNAVRAFMDADRSLRKHAPFIPEMFYEEFDKILKLCQLQISWYPDFRLQKYNYEIIKELIKDERDCWKRTETIMTESNNLTKKLREYLKSLEVLDEKE